MKEDLLAKLQKSFFSLRMDESSINGTSQLDLNVSSVQGKMVIKSFF